MRPQRRPKAKARGAPKRKNDGSDTDGVAAKRERKKGVGKGVGEAPEKLGGENLWELPREKVALALIGEKAPMMRWRYVVRDDSRRSYAAHLPNPLAPDLCQSFFARIRDGTEWKQPLNQIGELIPRKTAWLVWGQCQCCYRYGGIEVPPLQYPPWMVELMSVVMPYFGLNVPDEWPNSCNANLYEDGGMSVGWHSDDERLFQGKFQDIRILSVSFGTTRKFQVRLNWPGEAERKVYTLALQNGDLMSMEGMLQKHMQHRVPREEGVAEPRINLTWRWVVKHDPRCPVERLRYTSFG